MVAGITILGATTKFAAAKPYIAGLELQGSPSWPQEITGTQLMSSGSPWSWLPLMLKFAAVEMVDGGVHHGSSSTSMGTLQQNPNCSVQVDKTQAIPNNDSVNHAGSTAS